MVNSFRAEIGNNVWFELDSMTRYGTVKHIIPCLTNGRRHAVIEVVHALRGITYTVPLDELEPAPNFIFLSGIVNIFQDVSDERRFFAIHPLTPKTKKPESQKNPPYIEFLLKRINREIPTDNN